mgnify:CR=1 FL=1
MKKYSPTKINSTSPGFTLLEMLFAVIIFSFALISLMGIASKGVIATATARDQLTAQYLAEEALETARNTRDSNFLGYQASVDWMTDIDQCIPTSPCYVDNSGTVPRLVSCGGLCQNRYLYENEGVFSTQAVPGSDGPTTFSQELYVEKVGVNLSQRKAVATVRWKQKAFDRTFTVQTYLSDWQSPTTP